MLIYVCTIPTLCGFGEVQIGIPGVGYRLQLSFVYVHFVNLSLLLLSRVLRLRHLVFGLRMLLDQLSLL